MGVTLIHYSQERWQIMLDQQLMPIKQSHYTQAISIANNHGYLTQEFWVQVFHKLENTIHLSLMMKVKISLPLLHPLINTST
jgi:hypothetical protein